MSLESSTASLQESLDSLGATIDAGLKRTRERDEALLPVVEFATQWAAMPFQVDCQCARCMIIRDARAALKKFVDFESKRTKQG